jgi:hypothetical protein
MREAEAARRRWVMEQLLCGDEAVALFLLRNLVQFIFIDKQKQRMGNCNLPKFCRSSRCQEFVEIAMNIFLQKCKH